MNNFCRAKSYRTRSLSFFLPKWKHNKRTTVTAFYHHRYFSHSFTSSRQEKLVDFKFQLFEKGNSVNKRRLYGFERFLYTYANKIPVRRMKTDTPFLAYVKHEHIPTVFAIYECLYSENKKAVGNKMFFKCWFNFCYFWETFRFSKLISKNN